MCPNPGLGPALFPAGALPSAVHISMRVCALGSGFSELHAAPCSQTSTSGASAARRPWSSSRSGDFGALAARDYEFARCSHLQPNAPHVSSDWPCPGSLKALC